MRWRCSLHLQAAPALQLESSLRLAAAIQAPAPWAASSEMSTLGAAPRGAGLGIGVVVVLAATEAAAERARAAAVCGVGVHGGVRGVLADGESVELFIA